MLKVSLVGCGGIAQVHAESIIDSEQVMFLSCCDENFDKAAAFASKYYCKPFKSLKELIEYEKPDIVHICSPHYTHLPLTLYCFKNGIDVILEKPATSTPGDIEILKLVQRKYDRQLAICFQNRYNRSVQYAKEIIDSGKLGDLKGARALVAWNRGVDYFTKSDWRGSVNTEGASVLINQSIHTIDLIHYLLGDPVSIEGNIANRHHKGIINTEDTAEACFYYKDNTRVLFYASLAYCDDADIEVEIRFERGRINIMGDDVSILYSDTNTVDNPTFEKSKAFGKNYWGSSHALIINDFYIHVLEDKPFYLDAFEGTRALNAVFEIINSSQRGSTKV